MKAKHTFVVLLLLAFGSAAASRLPAAAAASGRPRLVDLGADKCIPCKLMAPILEELKREYAGRFDVVFIDVWKNRAEGAKYGISVIPTQIFYDAAGRERFRHEGFFSKQEILGKWQELGVDLASARDPGIVREQPVAADARPRDRVCFMCDGDVDARTRTVVKGASEQRLLCSPHCYFIYHSSIVGADEKSEAAKVTVTDWAARQPVAAVAATYLYGIGTDGRPTIRAFASPAGAASELAANPGSIVTWEVLRAKELATRCGFCDRAVYPEDACKVKAGTLHTYGCCTHCALGVAARLKRDIEVEARDGLTGEAIRVQTLDGRIASLQPASAVAWFGQKQAPDGSWVSAGCFKQGFFATRANLRKWLDARPAMTGREITIEQALADKLKLSSEQIAKACKLGECK